MDRADVIIFGGGLVGLALAAALDSSGISAIVVDPADPEQRKGSAFDGRTSAVSSSSMRMLRTIGVSDRLAQPGCPILRIAVADGLEPGGLHFDAEDDEPLGWMHENRHLRAALRATAEAGKNNWLLWKSRPTKVERGEFGVVVDLERGEARPAGEVARTVGRTWGRAAVRRVRGRPLAAAPAAGRPGGEPVAAARGSPGPGRGRAVAAGIVRHRQQRERPARI